MVSVLFASVVALVLAAAYSAAKDLDKDVEAVRAVNVNVLGASRASTLKVVMS